MSAHILMNLLNTLGKRDKMDGLLSILLLFHKFNKFRNTRARMLDSIFYMALSYDVVSRSEKTPCNRIDKPIVVYRFFGKCYDVHNNVAYMMTKLLTFYARNEISTLMSYDK